MFQTGSAPPAQPRAEVPKPATQDAPTSEFSKLFAAPPKTAMPEPALPPPPPPPQSSDPGEFTKMFNSPLPERSDPLQKDWSEPQPKLTEAGTFKRMFPAQPAAQSKPPEPSGGEFTRFFKTPQGNPAPASLSAPSVGPSFGAMSPSSPLSPSSPMNPAVPGPPQPLGASAKGPGEFTRMFGKPGHDPAADPFPAAGHQPSGATGAFSAPVVQPTAPPPVTPQQQAPPPPQQGPSEYTMMINRSGGAPAGAPGAPQAAPGVAPSSGGGGSPLMNVHVQAPYVPGIQAPHVQMPYVQQPNLNVGGVNVQGPYIPQPHIPQPHIPQPHIPSANVAVKGPSSNVLLYVMIALGALVIGLLIGVFFLKK